MAKTQNGRMKQPDESTGPNRKTLLKRTARKPLQTSNGKRRATRKNPLDGDVEQELVKTFSEK